MNRRFFLMGCLLLLAFISLPPASRAQFVPAPSLKKEKISSRPSPAKVTRESADALKGKGYVKIGEIFLKDEGKKCWGSNCTASFTCPSEQVKKDLTKEILKKAASKGGDLVVLFKDNTMSKEGINKRGKCLFKVPITKTVAFQKCQSAGRDSVTGTYRTGSCTTEMRTVTAKECRTWETIGGCLCMAQSTGTVWRLDPDLGKRIEVKISAEAAKIAAEEAAKISANKAKISVKNEAIALSVKDAAFMLDNRLDPSAPTLVYENGKYGYRDKNGNMAIPAQFDYARPFAEGMARVRIGTEHGYIDKKGVFVIKGQFDSAEDFSQGLSAVGVGPDVLAKKYGYIDTKGEFVIPTQFDGAKRFSEGLAAVAVGKLFEPERWGYIDKAGKRVIRPGYYDAGDFSEGLAPVAIGNIVKRKWGYINKDGVIIIKPAFDDALGFSEGLAPIAAGILTAEKKWGYINKDGQMIIQPSFSEVDSFSEGLAKVKVAGKCGYIDKSGTLVIKPQFDRASSFLNSEARVILNGAQAFIDKSGNISTQTQ
jgi:hypothetical protein